jgi:glutamyl-tRNA synthetase
MPGEEYVARARPYLEAALGPLAPEYDDEYVAGALLLEQERAKTLGELPELAEFFFHAPSAYDEKGDRKWFRREGAAELLADVREALDAAADYGVESIEAAIRAVAEKRDIKAAPVIHTTRLAVTGRTKGPGLFELMAVLGKERVAERLARAERHIESLE